MTGQAQRRERTPRRLQAALRAYPSAVRQADGDVLLSLACEMADSRASSTAREALGLVRGGLLMRAGSLGTAPWEDALRRAALPISAALLALVCGAAAFVLHDLSWPGWSWIAVAAGPALVVAGMLGGRRAPLAAGAVLVVLLGLAQGNGRLSTVRLEATIDWSGGGLRLPLLACAIPAALLLLAASAHAGRRASRSAVARTLAWVTAGALTVRFVLTQQVTVGDVRLDGLAICAAAYGIAAVVALAFGVGRRRRDPAGMLAGTLAGATMLPVAALYGISGLPLADGPLWAVLAATQVAVAVVLVHVVRRTPSAARRT